MIVQALRQTGWMVVRQLRNLIRQPIWVVMMVVQPMIWLVLYGQLFSKVTSLQSGTGSYVEFLAPGIICMNAFFGGMWSGMGMITDLDRKVVDRFLAAPASRLAIVLSQVVRAGSQFAEPGIDWRAVPRHEQIDVVGRPDDRRTRDAHAGGEHGQQ